MNSFFFSIIVSLSLLGGVPCLSAQMSFSTQPGPGAIRLFNKDGLSDVVIDDKDAEVVRIVGEAFCKDLELLSGRASKPVYELKSGSPTIIAGTLGHSKLIDGVAGKSEGIRNLKGKWEAFYIGVQNNTLVVAGSDPRGTAYGLFEISRRMGVHPFYWWADINPQPQSALYVTVKKPVEEAPSVQYRGIFLNDEDWGLKPWAAANIDKDVRDIGPQTYKRIFELMLRLKANYLWPAMHHCTKAFWYYDQNPAIAKKYGIVLGASHCEPMLRNNVTEWVDEFKNEYGKAPGDWRYDKNREQIYRYWDDRVKESAGQDAVYTIGMRGIHDGSMPGPASLVEKRDLMQQVIADQRGMLAKHLMRPATEVPQIFCPYKEVLDIYQTGLKLPDDVTIAWADDNHGYVRQLPNPVEQKKSGGGGIYYHLSYYGKPADYLWLSSISPSLISYELNKAYDLNARKLWVFNVGDLKPAEAELQFAMDLAWNVKAWPAETAINYSTQWATEIFGTEPGKKIGHIKEKYYTLAAGGKPEHLNKISYSKAEIQYRIEAYQQLEKEVDEVSRLIPARLKDAYFQLISYPVRGASLMNQKILKTRLTSGSIEAMTAYKEIQTLTKTYNNAIAGGKWSGMMDAAPRQQAVFQLPDSVADRKDRKNVPHLIENPLSVVRIENFTKISGDIRQIRGLGSSGVGLTREGWDHGDSADLQTLPNVEYTVSFSGVNPFIKVKCLPTFRLYEGLKLRYGIAINDEKPQWVNIETLADGDAWAVNVLRGYAAGFTPHQAKSGLNKLRIYLPDAGLVLTGIEILNKVD